MSTPQINLQRLIPLAGRKSTAVVPATASPPAAKEKPILGCRQQPGEVFGLIMGTGGCFLGGAMLNCINAGQLVNFCWAVGMVYFLNYYRNWYRPL